MKDEALKKAEHALEGVLQVPEKISMMYILEVVRFIREAREEKQQEPVADEIRCPECGYLTKHTEHIGCLRNQLNTINAFEQRNFAIVNMDKFPQPALRKPLTDEEIESMWIGSVGFLNPMLNQHTRLAFARAIEAKHNIKE